METLDIRDQYILTLAIKKLIRTETFRGREILPLVGSPVRKFKMTVREADMPYGIGQFKAPGADTPMAEIKGKKNDPTVTYISAVDLEEMILLEETDKLESADALVRADKIDDIIDLGRLLQLRNERLTELMRWMAVKNVLQITFPDGTVVDVDQYGSYAATHICDTIASGVAAAVDWSDTGNSTPKTDLELIADLIETDSTYPAMHVWMRRSTFRYFQRSAQWSNYLTFLDRPYRVVNMKDISELCDIPNFHIYEGGWKDNDGTTQYYLPEDHILVTTDPVVDGIKVGQVFDAPVVLFKNGRLVVQNNPGMSADTFVDPLKTQEFLRVKTARMAQLTLPECFAYVRVVASS
ncbi:major capsid protein [Chloroflexota bacterium]